METTEVADTSAAKVFDATDSVSPMLVPTHVHAVKGKENSHDGEINGIIRSYFII